jgi:hypothetical protein
MRKSMILAAALAFGAAVAAAEPKKDIGYESHADVSSSSIRPLRKPRRTTSSCC